MSASEISHDLSEKYMPISSSVGFFTIVQNDVRFCFLLRGKWHEVPIGDKKYVILSASEISHRTIALLVVIARHEVPRQSP